MKIIVGLGNPGQEYIRTRHNVGFMAVDALAEQLQVTNWKRKFTAELAETKLGTESVLLVKPQTYMNASGDAVGQIMRWYKATSSDVIVIHDDMDTPVGMARLKKHGSSGGHRGIESLLVNLGTEEFARVRIGIGRPAAGWTVVDHVLAKLSGDDQTKLAAMIDKLLPAIECIVKQGIDKAMNRYSFKSKPEQSTVKEEAKR